MAERRRHRRSERELARDAREAARLRFEERLPTVDVAKRMGLRGGTAEARRLIEKSADYVGLQLVDLEREPTVDRRRGDELASALGIPRALVVESDQASKRDDDIHPALGRIAAGHFLTILRASDTVAVSAGRGAGMTIRAIRQAGRVQRHAAFQGAGTTVSLAAGIYLASWSDVGLAAVNDADHNAVALGSALEWGNWHLCSFRAYVEPAVRARVIEDWTPHLDGDHTPEIDIALYGAAVVDATHYVMRIVNDPQAEMVAGEREELERLDEEHGSPVLIDHCHHFWVSSAVEDPGIRARAQKIADELNQKIVAARPSTLSKAKERILVAGGAGKAGALVQMASPQWKGPRPTTLVTDRATAATVLAQLNP